MAWTSNVSCFGQLEIVLFLNFLKQLNVLIWRAVAWSYWGLLYGASYFFKSFLSYKLEKTASIQEKLADLGDPQVELHLLRSCIGVCKVMHLLC